MASLSDSSTWLTSLIGAGADAMTNLYYVTFYSGTKDGDLGEEFTVRLSNISGLPSFSHKTESKKFMTVDFDAPVDNFDFEKKITLEFRLDQSYDIYTKLTELQAKTSKPSLGYATTRISGDTSNADNRYGFSFVLKIPTDIPAESTSSFNEGLGNATFKELYRFEYCWISKISGLESFSWDSSGSRTVKAEVYYYNWSGPSLT
jgi:hypothetical protein